MGTMARTLTAPWLILLGALSFWGPELLIYTWTRRETTWGLITFLLPGTLLVAYFLALFFRRAKPKHPSAAIFMLVGVWFFGSSAMLVGATLLGGGFHGGSSGALVALLLGLLPPYTFIMATYDGSLLGLLLATALMPACHFAFERRSWIVPHRWPARLNRNDQGNVTSADRT